MEKVAASILGIKNKKDLINSLIKNNINQIHYDVMDGKFVENTSMSIYEVLEIINNSPKHITDVHLMTVDPNKQMEILDGKVDYITFHIEACQDVDLLIKNKKSKIGISIKPNTSIKSITKYLDIVSHVLIMSVEPGKGGQSFINDSLDKIQKLRNLKPNLIIQIDGGINDITGPACFRAGASSVVSGSYLINNLSQDIIKKLT